jgi:hypothetical protein
MAWLFEVVPFFEADATRAGCSHLKRSRAAEIRVFHQVGSRPKQTIPRFGPAANAFWEDIAANKNQSVGWAFLMAQLVYSRIRNHVACGVGTFVGPVRTNRSYFSILHYDPSL